MNYKMTESKSSTNMDKKPAADCQICCETFNKTTRSRIECGHCDLEVCKKCVRYYLLGTTSGAHCMGCKNAWERDFTQKSLNKSFYNGDYKNRRKDLLFEGEKARFPETMPAVENYRNIQTWQKEEKDMQIAIDQMREQLWELEKNKRKINNSIRRAKTGEVIEEKKEASQFIRKCPADGCEGFLSSAWKCGVCNIWACSHCFAAKGFDKNAEHTCNPDDVASAELIKKETKPCPACGTRIFKISGCDQMWCTACHIAFSWRTGMRVNGVIHNPHFYAFQREGGAAVIQNPGAQICGGLPTYYQIRDRKRALYHNKVFRKWIDNALSNMKGDEWKRYTYPNQKLLAGLENNIQNIHRGANHFQYTILDRFRQHCQQAQDNKELRIKFICGEMTEQNMKTQLLKRDTQYNKRQALLHVYELMGAVYTETVIDIHNAMLEFVRDNQEVSEKQTPFDNVMQASRVLKVLKRIHTNIMKTERVRIYCNIELCKISAIYHQGVDIIDGSYNTPKFNKERCKRELLKKNAGELQHKIETICVNGVWRNRPLYEDDYHRHPVYI